MRITWANRVTLARLGLAVVFFALLAQFRAEQFEQRWWLLDVCLGVYIVAALTDILDGYLARKYDQVTSFGRVIDPFVDKVLICGAFVFFASEDFLVEDPQVTSYVAPWMVVVILGREFLVTGLRGFSESQGSKFAATVYGKVKMFIQCVTVGVIIGCRVHGHAIWGGFVPLRITLVWLTVVVTTLSLLGYLSMARPVLGTRAGEGGRSS